MFVEERIEWSTPCKKCKRKANHNKKTMLSELPPYLIIVIQRYARLGRKNNSSVNFSNELNLSKWCDDLIDRNGNYTLRGLTNHSGSMDFGHYYAYCRGGSNGEWFECNDSSVMNAISISNKSSNSSSGVYGLIYERDN